MVRFGVGQFFKRTPKIIHVAAHALLIGATVYQAFGVDPDHWFVTMALIFNVAAAYCGSKQE